MATRSTCNVCFRVCPDTAMLGLQQERVAKSIFEAYGPVAK